MIRSRLLAAALGLTCLVLAAPPASAEGDAVPAPTTRAATAAEWKTIRKLLPAYLWQTDEKRRLKLRVDERWAELPIDHLTLDRAQFAELGEILRNGSPFTTEKRRSQTLMVPTGSIDEHGEDEAFPVRVAATTKYKPGCGKSFPLIVTLHGGPCAELERAQVGSKTQFDTWRGFISTNHCIVAAPALTGSRTGPREWDYLRNVIDAVDRIYNVDRDRVLLTGHSWGGIMTWSLGPANADRFALLAPFICAGTPDAAHLTNCRALPIHHVQGKGDGKWIVENGRERRDLLDELGIEHTYEEPSGGHEIFGTQVARVAKRFANTRRALYADHIELRPAARATRGPDEWWYWVRTLAPEFEGRIDKKTRTIDLTGEGPFEIFLADEMLDLDEPIRIRLNDQIAFEGSVERRLAFALRHVEETGDRARVFATSVSID